MLSWKIEQKRGNKNEEEIEEKEAKVESEEHFQQNVKSMNENQNEIKIWKEEKSKTLKNG